MGPELRGLQNAVVEYNAILVCSLALLDGPSAAAAVTEASPRQNKKKVACSFLGACASTVDPLLEDLPPRHNVDFQTVRRP